MTTTVPQPALSGTHPDTDSERTTDPTPLVPSQVNGGVDTDVPQRTERGAPIVEAVKIRRVGDGHRVVTIHCPWCGRKHQHGLPAGFETVGHRVSHCDRDTQHLGYVVTLPELAGAR